MFASDIPERFDLLYRALEHIQEHGSPLETDITRFEQIASTVREQILELRSAFPENRITDWQIIRTRQKLQLIDSQRSPLIRLRVSPWVLLSDETTLCWDGHKYRVGPPIDEAGQSEADLIRLAQKAATAGQDNAFWANPATVHVTPDLEEIEKTSSLSNLRSLAVDCSLCDLCHHASRTVSGEGTTQAQILFVGEQPGDQEDLQGRPFVGPAGQLFERALQEAGGNREQAWISNAVKHFKFVPRGTRRIHQKPDAAEVASCAPWIAAERRILHPKVTVLLGVTGASSVLGRSITISRERSRYITLEDGSTGIVTVHPSYLLRIPDEDSRTREYTKFVADLRMAISALA
ncbi:MULTISPECIES: UdgX family uracil-DNA binding protein [unclassified Gluconobacter]|uniref:UdgX family uracil-DNA binding protein n=1 Tax=unclassified Gluconobacter TaxID=2644261 RepID=UPI001F19207F|nr:UdgX family uracil-DNA binding protein [Gluconobacter sp. Gdi]